MFYKIKHNRLIDIDIVVDVFALYERSLCWKYKNKEKESTEEFTSKKERDKAFKKISNILIKRKD